MIDWPGRRIAPVTKGWVRTIKPGWRPLEVRDWGQIGSREGRATTYLILDRSCFTEEACTMDPRSCGTPYPSPYGSLNVHCHEALAAADWRLVADIEIDASRYQLLADRFRQPIDLVSYDQKVRVAILRAK